MVAIIVAIVASAVLVFVGLVVRSGYVAAVDSHYGSLRLYPPKDEASANSIAARRALDEAADLNPSHSATPYPGAAGEDVGDGSA